MGKLSLIGLGLYDEKDLTLRGIEEAKKSDEVFLDTYTGIWNGDLRKLEKIIGKKIQPLSRKDLEDNSSLLLDKASRKNLSILVQGDPLVATTHYSLLLEAKKRKINTKIVHNSSIYSAIAESGLHIQKFGETVTLPFPDRTGGKLPLSIYDAIKRNYESGLHTLCLLDIIIEEKKFLKISDAIDLILWIQKSEKDSFLHNESTLIAMIQVGSDKQTIYVKKLSEFLHFKEDMIPEILIIPGKLHFTEIENLKENSY